METINILQNKISYEDKGKGSPILLLPGIDGDCSCWNNQIDELSPKYRVILIDFKEINTKIINIHNLVQIIDNFIDAIQIDYFFIGGYSLGALLSLAYANRHPENILGILTTSLFNFNNSIDELLNFYNINIKHHFFSKLIFKLFKLNIENQIIYKYAYLLKYNLIMNEYSKINIPLLIINGENDHPNANKIASKIYNNNKNIFFDIIENSNYNCFQTHYNEYNEILFDFLSNKSKPK